MIYNIFAGIIIGVGLILPGVSGGVLAVILGVYEKMIYSLNNFMKSKKESFKFLFPIIVGVCIGLLIFGNILKFLFSEYEMQACFAFIGLILGGIPVLVKKAEEKGKINGLVFAISLILSLVLFILGNDKINFSNSLNEGFSSYIKLFLTGFLFISGKIIPGISSSFMLMLIGMYQYILNIVSNPLSIFSLGISQMLPLILGFIFGFILCVKLIGYLLKKYYCTTYSIIIGFVIGSLPAIYPGIKFNIEGLISILILLLCFYGSYKLSMIVKEK